MRLVGIWQLVLLLALTSRATGFSIPLEGVPKFLKEKPSPIVVEEGDPIILHCNPPEGVAPRQIYWMSIGLQHIEQDERVSMGTDGNLYFSNALQKDSRQDYCCFASFSRIRTIVQKTPMAVVVKSLKADNGSADGGDATEAPPVRIPSLLLPSGVQTEKVLLKGETLQLECIPQGYPTPEIKWMKMGEKLHPRTKFMNFGKQLTISAVEERDAGKYMCTAKNTAGQAVHYFDVIVEEPPKWLTEPPQSQLTVIGSDVHIKCSVSGKPPPDITWRRNGELFRDDPQSNRRVLDDTVVLHNAGPEDSAVYQCDASNSHGSILANINIMVMNMAPRILTRDYQEYAVVLGGDIIMNCSVFSSPPPAISCAEKNDSGKYVCVAFNTEGKSDVTAMLDVKDPTEIVDPPQDAQIISGTTAQFVCQAAYDKSLKGSFEVIWRKDGEEISLSFEENSKYVVDDGMLQIMNVNLSDQGIYTCIARTSIDQDNATALLTVLEFIVECEENQWEPGRWRELQKVPGNQATAELALHGHLNYQFRVYAVNVVGPGPPSEPTERYKTPPAGLEYKVSYRKLGVEDIWREHLVKRHSFVVRNTSTFVPYEIKIQSRNSHGWGPEPEVVTGYSGEDVPTAAPRDVAVEVFNTTVLRVSWIPAPPTTVRGHLGGYDVRWLRKRSLLNPNKILDERHSMSFPGNRSHAIVPSLEPFSEYRLTVNVFNKKGNGPNSDPVTFSTPEGVPEQVPILTASDAQDDSILLVWGPPLVANGILTGYLLQYHLINETTLEVVDSQEINITVADTTQWQLQGLKEGSLYRFHLSACTRAGCGPPLAQESSTVVLGLPALLNISSYVSDTFAKISWTAREEQQDSQLYVAYMNNRLHPGAVYTVRLMAKRLLDNASIFEDVIQTQVKGVEGLQRDISTQGWIIGTMCAVVLLTLVALMACFVRRNKGGKYAGTPSPNQRRDMFSMEKVKEKEDLHPDVESQGMNDDTFCEYSDSDEKPLKGSSLSSLNGDDAVGDGVSRDSLVDYADGGGEFNEDGSFIGEYSGRRHGGSVSEPSGPSTVTA
ncbi:L1-like protein Close -like protein of L1 Processed neural cell adhesion molecule [Collichthys lucidus]|uniref:L1-like protein Close-like protein of L1 Processed neural cell adhesion molecule n=1 Tax=Collichthys lucidus TaxID=240159 RepID=A0A4U5UQV0_COLLU|nr:L1-like protein Close -like protein of L1 Processed neural cell adhesion molecule [Collichthys lucidus]